MYWQWYAIGLIGFFAGFVLGRWWWTVFLAPLPFIAFWIAYENDTFCQPPGANSDCLDGLGWAVITALLSIGWAIGALFMIGLRLLMRHASNKVYAADPGGWPDETEGCVDPWE
jgi:hypothetical protein